MNSRLWIFLPVLLMLSALPLAAQETIIVAQGGSAPAFACAEADCERLAWLPDGAGVSVIAEVQGRELDGSSLWYEVTLECPCFDFEHRYLDHPPAVPISDEGSWTLWQPVWSPDGSRIAAAVDTELYVWDAAGGALLTQESHAPFLLLHPAWSPNGAEMVVTGLDEGGQRSQVWLLDARGQSRQSLDGHSGWIAGAAWSPDGSRIAAVGDELRIWDAQQRQSLPAIETFAIAMHWSPDGERIVTVNHRDEAAQVWDAADGALLFSLGEESAAGLPWVDWSPDGARIFTFDVMASIIHVWDAANGQLVGSLEESDSGYIFDADWSPDGKYIFYVLTGELSGRLKRWSAHEQDPPLMLYDSNQGILDFSLSPDGKFLATGIENEVRILDAAQGRLLANLARPESDKQSWFTSHVAWSPEGGRVAAAETVYGWRRPADERSSLAHVWDLTLIAEGPTRAFIHSSHVGDSAADER